MVRLGAILIKLPSRVPFTNVPQMLELGFIFHLEIHQALYKIRTV